MKHPRTRVVLLSNKRKLEIDPKTWMALTGIVLVGREPVQKVVYCIVLFMEHSQNDRFMER